MDFYFTDRSFNLIGVASTDASAPISITGDQDISSIEEASRTFRGTILFDDFNRETVKEMAAIGNYVLYKDQQGKSMFTTIMEIEHDPKNGEHYFVAEDAGMDLINGLVGPYEATKEMTYAEYFKVFAGDTGFEIRINEISNLKRTLKWEGESMTIRARLISMATQFDNAEIEFAFEITGTQVVNRFIDIKKKIGNDNRVTLYVNKDINNIVTKANIYDLCTAIMATGGTPEGQNAPINLKGYNYNDPNGRFVLNRTTGVMQDMESVKIWSRLLSNDNKNPNAGHIMRVKSYETTNQKTLADNVVRELEKVSQPIINYETDIANLPDNVLIGDTIYLVDEDEKLFLSARVLELTRIYSENKYTATLGDYLIQQDGINQDLKELAEQLKQSTTYVWIRYADDEDGNGISATPAGKTYIAIKQVLGVPNASDDPNDYRGLWTKFVGEGIPGPPGEDGQTTYTWLKYADDSKGSNMSDDPAGKFYIGMATNKTTSTESTNPADYKWQLVKGEDGQDAHIYQAYAWNADGTDRFTINYPNENILKNGSLANNIDGWTKGGQLTVTSNGEYTTLTKPGTSGREALSQNLDITIPQNTDYSISVMVYVESFTGNNDGQSTIFLRSVKDSGSYLDSPIVAIDTSKIGVWQHLTDTRKTPNEGINSPRFTVALGTQAMSIRIKLVKLAKGSTALPWTPQPSEDFFGAFPSYSGTYTTFDAVQSTDPSKYTWQRILGESGKDGKDGIAGKDGVGVSDTNITYAQSTSGTTPPSTGWTAQVPTLVKGQYLWTKTVWTYTDASTETGYTVSYNAKDGNDGNDGVAGKDGVGIESTIIEYVGAVSGTSKPTSGWSTTIPTVPAGQYLWTRTTWQYTDGTSEQGFTNALMGRTGASGKDGVAGKDGVGIKSTQIMYAQSTSGTTAPSTGWTAQVPTLIKGQYLWTQTTWVYTDNTGESGYTVSYNAKDGNDGNDGIAGKDGVGIASTKVEYVGSSSGTVKPTTGWSTTIPTVAEGNFLWTRTTWTYTDSTSEVGYSVAKMGARGPQGIQGPQGPNGQTYYTWLKYADTPTSGMSDSPTGKTYMGLAYNKTSATESTNYSDYSWSLIKGADGVQGPQGPDGKTTYTWIKYGTSSSGANMSDDPTGRTYIGIAYNKTTATESTNPADYSWSLIKGDKGDTGPQGPSGNGIKNSTIAYAANTSGTTAPTTGWQATPPNVAANSFLWTRVIINYTDGTNSTSYSVGKMGAQGPQGTTGAQGPQGATGNGISGSVVNYTSSTSGTTAPSSGWQATPPTVAANQYLWTRVVISYTNGTSSTAYSVGKMGAQGPQGVKGDTGPQGPTGPTGNGISSSTINYAASTSGTTAPTSGWATTPPTVAANSFLWTRVIINYTSATSTTAYSVGKMGAQGPKGDTGAQGPTGPTGPQGPQGIQGVAYLQPTQPSTTQNGAQWFKTVSTTNRTVTEIYTYVTGSGWVKTPLASGSLSINTLAAISANLGNITAGTIDGVEIRGEGLYSEYDYQIVTGGTTWRKGKLSMAGGYFRNDFKTYVKSTGAIQNNGFSQFSHEAIQFVVFEGTQTTKPDRTLSITPYSFTMTDDRGRGGSLTFQDLFSIGKTMIPANSGFRQYSTDINSANAPTAQRNGRVVQLAGAFAATKVIDAGGSGIMGTLPVGFRPSQNCNYIVQASGTNIFLLTVMADGRIQMSRHRGALGSGTSQTWGDKTVSVDAWLNIACCYAAANV